NILGRTITIDGEARAVVGVLPRGFQLPIPGMRDAELWLPIHVPLTSDNAANGALLCLGLLKRNVTPAQSAAALTPPLSDLRRDFWCGGMLRQLRFHSGARTGGPAARWRTWNGLERPALRFVSQRAHGRCLWSSPGTHGFPCRPERIT